MMILDSFISVNNYITNFARVARGEQHSLFTFHCQPFPEYENVLRGIAVL